MGFPDLKDSQHLRISQNKKKKLKMNLKFSPDARKKVG